MKEIIIIPHSLLSVGKIVCVGQNYSKHIKEMDSKHPDEPVLFLKPSTAIIHEGTPIILPDYSNEIHHEVELALVVTRQAKNIEPHAWKQYIGGADIALDLTLRDH